MADGLREKFKDETKVRVRLRSDFEFFAANALKITSKAGKLESFRLNKAQKYIHLQLESQLKEVGRVRALILKARQQGCSTYIAARFYWKVIHRKGVNAYVLSHAIDTTKKLFAITRRYHEHCPEIVQPETRAASATEFSFKDMDSSYYVGTAGSKETGRGGTIQLLHGSETAFWTNAETHFAGIMQSVPTGGFASDTEVVLESTANGIGNKFHELWDDSTKGKGDYRAIFTPWYWQEEYSTIAPKSFDLNLPEFEEYRDFAQALKMGRKQVELTTNQLYWMHLKRMELGSEWLFKQEYPATAEEAFQTSGDESFITPAMVMKAREQSDDILEQDYGPRIGACDPARFGEDRTSIGYRQGRTFKEVLYYNNKDTMEVAGIVTRYIQEQRLDRMFIDVNGLGAGVYDRLKENGYGRVVRPVNFGDSAIQKDKYMNKRAECWGEMRNWFEEDDVFIPNDDALHADLTSPGYGYDSRGRVKLESKDDMRKRGAKSPDGGDVLSMTFAEPVSPLLIIDRGSVTIDTDYDELNF